MDKETSIRFQGDFNHPVADQLRVAFMRSIGLFHKLPDWIRDMDGMSGRNYRYLINNFVELIQPAKYLEIGSWAGSTACSAMHGNKLQICCIDNWSQFGGPKAAFEQHTSHCRTEDTLFRLIEKDFRQVDYGSFGTFNIYMFDGPHSEQDQYDGIVIAQPALERTYTLIVDDWNWEQVRSGTERALEDLGHQQVASIEIRTTQDDSHAPETRQNSCWHNGYKMMVCSKA